VQQRSECGTTGMRLLFEALFVCAFQCFMVYVLVVQHMAKYPIASSLSPTRLSGVPMEWEEALWKQKDKDKERNDPMRSQDEEVGCEPHTDGQTLTGLVVHTTSLVGNKKGKQPPRAVGLTRSKRHRPLGDMFCNIYPSQSEQSILYLVCKLLLLISMVPTMLQSHCFILHWFCVLPLCVYCALKLPLGERRSVC